MAKHKSFIHPTHKRDPIYRPSNTLPLLVQQGVPLLDDDEAYFIEQAQCFMSHETRAVETQNEMMNDDSSHGDCAPKLKERLKNLENQIYYLQSKLSQQDSKQRSLLDTDNKESKGPPLNWRKTKQEANERFKDAATEALNGVVASHGT
jgi:hypothetical protein